MSYIKHYIQVTRLIRLHFISLILILLSVCDCYASDNATLGLPHNKSLSYQVVDRPAFCLGYYEKHEQPAWVCYKLTKKELQKKAIKRTDNFRSDHEIKTDSAQLVDYKGSGYDRGHLAPARDMAWSPESMSDSFYLSNMSPQEPGFNRGIWSNLEELVRTFALQNEEVLIVTGPLLTDDLKSIGPNKVSVPDFYYKVILDYHGTEKKGIAFLLPNKSSKEPLIKYAKSIDDIELVTGLNFFCKITEPELEKTLESSYDCKAWGIYPPSDSSSAHKKTNDEQPSEKIEGNSDSIFWISTNSDIRHNSSCRWYKKSKGRLGSKNKGRACKLCGG